MPTAIQRAWRNEDGPRRAVELQRDDRRGRADHDQAEDTEDTDRGRPGWSPSGAGTDGTTGLGRRRRMVPLSAPRRGAAGRSGPGRTARSLRLQAICRDRSGAPCSAVAGATVDPVVAGEPPPLPLVAPVGPTGGGPGSVHGSRRRTGSRRVPPPSDRLGGRADTRAPHLHLPSLVHRPGRVVEIGPPVSLPPCCAPVHVILDTVRKSP